jgi:hypothetical protein
MARDYGVVSITLDGKPVASSFDGYNAPKSSSPTKKTGAPMN